MYSFSHDRFGKDAVEALVNNITHPDYHGNLLVIMAGYEDKMEELFQHNPGLRSRYDKKRLLFPSWTADMATNATIKKIEKDGLSITKEAQELLSVLYRDLVQLPDWGSARDVYENIGMVSSFLT